jgi:translation initiation factor IF-1
MSPKKEKVQKVFGQALEALPNTTFRVRLDTGEEIIAYLAGRLRMYRIKVLPGDRVTIELSPYDKARGRIVYRGK